MVNRQEDITYFATTDFRGKHIPFGIRRTDRRYHMHVIGKTGTGKSTLMKTMMVQDLARGEGLALFDPHGDLIEEVLALVPDARAEDLVFLDTPGDGPWTFNPLAGVAPEDEPIAVAGLVEAFQKIWSDDWGPRLEHLLRNVLYTLLPVPDATIADIPRLLTNDSYRKDALRHLKNKEVESFWREEYERYSWKFRAVVVAPLQNKVGAFLADPRIRAVFAAPETSFDLREVMDEGKILLVRLSKGKLGEGPAGLIGSLLVSAISREGLSRVRMPEEGRRDFYLYLDEFHTFSTLSLATMLSELRKYRVNLILANQYFSQLEPAIRDAVLGNAGTLMSFRVGAPDAALLAREFQPTFRAEDLVNLPNYHVYLRLMIGGQVSRAFSGNSIRPCHRHKFHKNGPRSDPPCPMAGRML